MHPEIKVNKLDKNHLENHGGNVEWDPEVLGQVCTWLFLWPLSALPVFLPRLPGFVSSSFLSPPPNHCLNRRC